MKINSRTVSFFELQLQTLPAGKDIPKPPQLPIGNLIPILATLIPAGFEIKCGSTPIEVTCSRWDPATGELHLLLNKPDPERSDVAYRRRGAKVRRLGNKAPDEDIEVSSHVVISPGGSPTIARMMMTIGANIGPQKIVSLLHDIYRTAKDTARLKKLREPVLPINTLDAKGKPKTYKVNHKFTYSGMPNGQLREILQTGKVVGLHLISNGEEAFDSSTRIKMDKMTLHVNLERESVRDVSFIRGLVRLASTSRKFDADQVRIEYKDSEADTAIKARLFNTSRLEEAFTRTESIELDIPHMEHQTHFSEEIIAKMRALI
jgi:hypothetical protein